MAMSDSQPGSNLPLANLADVMPGINQEKNTPRNSEPIIVIEVVRFLCALLVLGVHYFTGFWFLLSGDLDETVAAIRMRLCGRDGSEIVAARQAMQGQLWC